MYIHAATTIKGKEAMSLRGSRGGGIYTTGIGEKKGLNDAITS